MNDSNRRAYSRLGRGDTMPAFHGLAPMIMLKHHGETVNNNHMVLVRLVRALAQARREVAGLREALDWYQNSYGTREEIEAEDRRSDEDFARIMALSDEDVTAELRAAGYTDAHEAKGLASVRAIVNLCGKLREAKEREATAREEGARGERARTVAWLRGPARTAMLRDPLRLADGIEQGAHVQQGSEARDDGSDEVPTAPEGDDHE